MCSTSVLLIESFYGGSHKQLMDLLMSELSNRAQLFTLPAKKWHWRSIASALYFSEVIPREHKFRVLFASSVLPLADLVALRPDLAALYKIVYFHENQMVYPVRGVKKERYFQHGYNEVLSCLTADKVLFNSNYNRDSFLSSLKSFFSIMPDHRPKDLHLQILPKSSVLYYPVKLPEIARVDKKVDTTEENIVSSEKVVNLEDKLKPLHIVWPHRWEHDKNPEAFFSVMFRLKKENIPFKLSVIGESFTEKPKIFEEASLVLKDDIIHWGYQKSKEEYFSVLHSADVVVSTADHEFFGVSMIEATSCNCYPLCPNKLVYPEIYSDAYLYNTSNQLYKKLKYFCRRPFVVRNLKTEVNLSKFSWETLKSSYMKLLQ